MGAEVDGPERNGLRSTRQEAGSGLLCHLDDGAWNHGYQGATDGLGEVGKVFRVPKTSDVPVVCSVAERELASETTSLALRHPRAVEVHCHAANGWN